MKIKVTSVYVDDQNKALRFYTEVLGFAKKADFSQGPFRWLTVASPEEPDGVELQLALNDNPAAKAYQQAMFQQNQPAVMFFTDDVKGDYERIKARGAEFTMPPTDGDRLDYRNAERHLRQPHSAYPAGTLLKTAVKEKDDRSQAVRAGSRRRGAGTKGWKQVDAYSRPRTAPLAGKSLAGANRPGASARVGALRRRREPGYGWNHGEAHHSRSTRAAHYRNNSDASRRSQGA